MNLSFATDSKRFSKAVEQLRKEGIEITEVNIKARYELLGKEKPVEKKEDAPVVDTVVTEEPKKKTKKAK